MCGITGFLGFSGDDTLIIESMVAAINHRGPDAQHTWSDNKNNLSLGHARLAVVDLSEAGRQPMRSHTGRFVVSYNGEVYNHLDIRTSLIGESAAPNWIGSSDTETIVAALDAWGVEKTLRACVGMFAIAIWDSRENKLFLARDRFGEKPLYYQPEPNGVIFGSELAAIEQHPLCKRQVSESAVFELATKQCIGAPLSIYKGVFKLLPGSLVVFNSDGFVTTHIWWSALETAIKNGNTWKGTTGEALEESERILEQCVKRQMQSDVPLGAFLSGGIDSSVIVAMMQKNHSTPVKTYSIGFTESTFNEAEYAAKVAKHLGTAHTEFYVKESDVCDLVPDLSRVYSEPFADSSQLPTYLVSKLSREDVTVVLTGDAGDEIFGGYNRHQFAQKHWPMISKVPLKLRHLSARIINSMNESRLDQIFSGNRITANWTRVGERLHRVGHILSAKDIDALYRLSTTVKDSSHVLRKGSSCGGSAEDMGPQVNLIDTQKKALLQATDSLDNMRWMMVNDQLNYLPNDILAKVDRASMCCSLETRAPFLDHTFVEFTQSLPTDVLSYNNRSKFPLRKILEKHVPLELFERPKMGFSVPIHNMIKNQLREWSEFHLSSVQLDKTGVFDTTRVRALWADHSNGKSNNIAELWPVLVYQAWAYDRAVAN